MTYLYISKITDYQAAGNQIDIPKKIAVDFFKVPEAVISAEGNHDINICHRSQLRSFEPLQIQTATNPRFSIRLNSFLKEHGDALSGSDLLVVEKLERSYCFHCLKSTDDRYEALLRLFEEGERHLLLSSYYEDLDKDKPNSSEESFPLQQIFYGAPGTGKSYTVDEVCKKYKHYRTTFHPDSDYSTFVGCYKPSKEKATEERIYSADNLKGMYIEFKQNCPSRPEIRFAAKYSKSIEPLSIEIRKSIFEGSADSVVENELPKAIAAAEEVKLSLPKTGGSITYAFNAQAFTDAYIEAWKNPSMKVFLIIEEINRGNCAQIFGDLFQLLDRDDEGYSKYEINPDSDLQNYISEKGLSVSGVLDSDGKDISNDIADGTLLKLPKNLHIWATMNTSDQSLFPIDSAFKRRWDWKYVPITEGVDKVTKAKLNYRIKFDVDSSTNVDVSWWDFIRSINNEIEKATKSEDKKLGYFFCKAKDGVIDAETFVGKVVFYLWQDVFKDYGFKSEIFKSANGKISFHDFYDGEGLDLTVAKTFIDKVITSGQNAGILPKPTSTALQEESKDQTAE